MLREQLAATPDRDKSYAAIASLEAGKTVDPAGMVDHLDFFETPGEFAAFIRRELDKWGRVVERAHIERQ